MFRQKVSHLRLRTPTKKEKEARDWKAYRSIKLDDDCCKGSKVYFIADGNAVKIGYSVCPESRMASLEPGNPRPLKIVGTMRGGHKTENAIHQLFGRERIRFEWFRLTKRLKTFIAEECDKPAIVVQEPRKQCETCGGNGFIHSQQGNLVVKFWCDRCSARGTLAA